MMSKAPTCPAPLVGNSNPLSMRMVVDTPKAIKESFVGELLEVRAADLWAARKLLRRQALVRGSLAMGDRLMITVDTAAKAMEPIKRALEQAGLTDIAIEPAQPNLEELFVQIVRRGEE